MKRSKYQQKPIQKDELKVYAWKENEVNFLDFDISQAKKNTLLLGQRVDKIELS